MPPQAIVSRLSTSALLSIGAVLVLLFIMLAYSTRPLAAQGSATEPGTSTLASAPAGATSSPFANALTQMAEPKATSTLESASSATFSMTPSAVTSPTQNAVAGNPQATIQALQSEVASLQTKLAAAQSDKGATLYALVVVVLGLLLAGSVYFGLKRS